MTGLRARIAEGDRRAIRWTHRVHWRPLTLVMKVVTYGATGPVWFVVALALFALRWTDRATPLTDDFLRAMLAALGGWAVGNLLRLLIRRPRPFLGMEDHEALIRRPIGGSMPSTHAASSMGLATALFTLGHPAAGPVLALALMTTSSRLYLGVHYPSDLVVGTAIGVGFGLLPFPWM